MDILIFAAIAGFFVYRLVQNLGQVEEVDYENVKMKNVNNPEDTNIHSEKPLIEENLELVSGPTLLKYPHLESLVEKLHKINSDFTESNFSNSTKLFYNILKDAVLNNKIDELKPFIEKDSIISKIKKIKFFQNIVEIACKVQLCNIEISDSEASVDVELSAQDMLLDENNKIINYNFKFKFVQVINNKDPEYNEDLSWLLRDIIVDLS